MASHTIDRITGIALGPVLTLLNKNSRLDLAFKTLLGTNLLWSASYRLKEIELKQAINKKLLSVPLVTNHL